ncbi:uncharacterized protein [Physcomitrium patens]|uniref:uncharacterized protein isoform X2 n=1 Tax=Physcomitrium patens TaxID=3218 RepID=UPI003CCCE145
MVIRGGSGEAPLRGCPCRVVSSWYHVGQLTLRPEEAGNAAMTLRQHTHGALHQPAALSWTQGVRSVLCAEVAMNNHFLLRGERPAFAIGNYRVVGKVVGGTEGK